jgi:hypothetical protein
MGQKGAVGVFAPDSGAKVEGRSAAFQQFTVDGFTVDLQDLCGKSLVSFCYLKDLGDISTVHFLEGQQFFRRLLDKRAGAVVIDFCWQVFRADLG